MKQSAEAAARVSPTTTCKRGSVQVQTPMGSDLWRSIRAGVAGGSASSVRSPSCSE